MIPISDDTPRIRLPVVTWGLIALNVVVFWRELGLGPEEVQGFFATWGLVPQRVTSDFGLDRPTFLPFFTSLFVHGDWMHLIGNLWMLWIFGDNVEDRIGRLPYLLFYLACGVIAGAIHVASDPGSPLPTIGASGAIAGVLGAYFLLFPRARVLTVIPILIYPLFVVIPAVVFLGLWFALQFLSGTAALAAVESSGGVAWWAHVGGFAAGAGLLVAFFNLGRLRREHAEHRRKLAWEVAARRRYRRRYGRHL